MDNKDIKLKVIKKLIEKRQTKLRNLVDLKNELSSIQSKTDQMENDILDIDSEIFRTIKS